jgi:hypothetical protein
MDWHLLLTTVLGSGLGTSLIALFFKRRFDRELESQKAILFRASRIHERQVDTLSNLYRYFSEVQAFLQLMASSARFAGEDLEQYPALFQQALKSANEQLLLGRLLIPQELARQCDELLKRCFEGRTELAYASIPETTLADQRVQLWDNAKAIAYKEIPKLLDDIEKSARLLIHNQQH